MRVLIGCLLFFSMFLPRNVTAMDITYPIPLISFESMRLVNSVLKKQNLRERDALDIQGCTAGIIHDIETQLKDVTVTEQMVTHYILLCIVIDIRMKDEELKSITERVK